jgi:hypothetical protein
MRNNTVYEAEGWQICEGREIDVRLYQIGTGIMDGRLL